MRIYHDYFNYLKVNSSSVKTDPCWLTPIFEQPFIIHDYNKSTKQADRVVSCGQNVKDSNVRPVEWALLYHRATKSFTKE